MYRETINDARLKNIIRVGLGNEVPSSELMIVLNLRSKRALQKFIENEVSKGALICASQNGYYLPRNESELQRYYEYEKRRTLKRLVTLKPIKEHLNVTNGQEEMEFDNENKTKE